MMALNGEELDEESLQKINELTNSHFLLEELHQKTYNLEKENQNLKEKLSETYEEKKIGKNIGQIKPLNIKQEGNAKFESFLISSDRVSKNRKNSKENLGSKVKMFTEDYNFSHSKLKEDTSKIKTERKHLYTLGDEVKISDSDKDLDESKKNVFKQLQEADSFISNLKRKLDA